MSDMTPVNTLLTDEQNRLLMELKAAQLTYKELHKALTVARERYERALDGLRAKMPWLKEAMDFDDNR